MVGWKQELETDFSAMSPVRNAAPATLSSPQRPPRLQPARDVTRVDRAHVTQRGGREGAAVVGVAGGQDRAGQAGGFRPGRCGCSGWMMGARQAATGPKPSVTFSS